MINLLLRPHDGSFQQQAKPCLALVTFRTWPIAARFAREDAEHMRFDIVGTGFTGKHKKDAARVRIPNGYRAD